MNVAADKNVLRVRRWTNQLLVPHDHPNALDLSERVASVLKMDLARALSATFPGAGAAGDDSIVFVRRLDLDWTIGAERDAQHIARQCAVALAQEVAAELASPECDNIVRFSSRTDYLAAYVTARATADGGRPWFYARFDGWSALTASGAIRSALCDDPPLGLAALRALSRPALSAVAASLDDGDARATVRSLASASDPSSSEAFPSLFESCLASCPPLSLLDRAALEVWLLVHTGAAPGAVLIGQAVVILRALHRAAIQLGVPFDDETLRSVREDPSVTSALFAAASSGNQAATDRVAATALANRGTAAPASRSLSSTSFGGVFLLLDDLAALPWATMTDGWPPLGEARPASVLMLAVLEHALTRFEWGRLFNDPFWRDRFGIPPTVAIDDVTAWLEQMGDARRTQFEQELADEPPSALRDDRAQLSQESVAPPLSWDLLLQAAATRVLRSFAQRLPGFAESQPDHLLQNFLAVAATVELEADRIVVTLSRPPLDLMLRIAGVNRGVRRWEWLDKRPFALFSEA